MTELNHRQTVTAESIVLLAQDPSATLPPAVDPAALVALLDCPSSTVPAAAYLNALLSLLSRSPPSPSLLSSLLLSFLRLFLSRRLPRGDAAPVFRLFAPHLPFLERTHLPSLLDLVVSDLSAVAEPDDALPLDLLPRLLDLAEGDELVDKMLDRLLAGEWSKSLLLKIVALLLELPRIGKARVSDFLDKIFSGMKVVDLQDLPSLIYQLLLLASKGINRREVISGILGFFGGFSKGQPSILRQVEGTVLMHVNFAVKQDPSLGREVLTIIRSDLRLINHFVVAVLFSMARVRRFNESCIGVLKMVVVTSHRDYKTSRDCKWLPDNLKEECLETAKRVEKSFLKAVNESNSGREHIVPSIVQFGFVLLESVDCDDGKQGGDSAGLMSIEELSIMILMTLFEVHDISRNEIIEQCKFRLLSLKPQKGMPIIKLLSHLVQSYPYPMLEYIAHLKELLDYFTFLQERMAIAIIDALLPLIRFSHDLQDYIILVVRKAMFKREETARVAATDAVINIISMENSSKKNGLKSFEESSSQASCSQQGDIPSRVEGCLFQELSGLLRRCLSQQARVKEILYEGLVKLVMLEPTITSSIFDVLWPHFLRVYLEDKDFPLQLDACFKLESGKVCVVEPLDHLLSCVSWLLLLQSHGKSEHQSEDSWPCFGFSLSQENEAGKATSAESFSNALFKIRRNLKNCKLQGPQGQREDSSCHSLQKEKNSCHWQMLLRIVEVFVNIIVMEIEKAEGENKLLLEKELMEFAELHNNLEKDSSMNKQRTDSRKGTSKELSNKINGELQEYAQVNQSRTFLATSTIHYLLLTAIESYNFNFPNRSIASQNNRESSSSIIDHCLKMMLFVLKVCLRHLKFVGSIRSGTSGDPFRRLLCGDIRLLGKPVMQLVWLLKSVLEKDKDQRKKDANVKMNRENIDPLFLSLLCLNELFKMNFSGAELSELVNDLLSLAAPELDLETGRNADPGINEEKCFLDNYQQMRFLHLFLEKRIEPLYSSLIDLSLFRESEVLAELLSIVGNKLPPAQRNSHGNWAVSVCQSKKVENSSAAQNVLLLAIHLLPAPTDLIVACDMASELLKVMGSEDKDPEHRSVKYPVINQSTRNAIATIILRVAESCIVDLEWAVSKVKAISACNHAQPDLRKNLQFAENLHGPYMQEVLYSRSESLVYLLSSFVEMKLKDSQAEQLLKITTRFYKLLAPMTKLQIASKGSKQFLPSLKFQKLAEVTCIRLTSPLYNFVALVQRNQNAQHKGIISKIKRENRCIPDLIFQIENYEKYLIQLSKSSNVNLLRYAKRSIARDFKILETKKVVVGEETTEHEHALSSSTSENESSGESEGPDEENISEKTASAEPNGNITDVDSENDMNDQEMLIRKKRTKRSKVVEDSDEEA
ncbi:unnamed protein product [Musa acuminata subsp. burmannicoides]